MKHLWLMIGLLGCGQTRTVAVTFGSGGEGLDGFLCKTPDGRPLLERVKQPDGGTAKTSLVVDFVQLQGVPGCRTGQLVAWCATHQCVPLAARRACVETVLPGNVGALTREDARAAVLTAMRSVGSAFVTADAPDEFVLVRVVGTTQRCDTLLPTAGASLPAFDAPNLVGCAYSCPVLFDKVEQDVYLGFETLTAQCEQGVRTCSALDLHWQP